MPDCTGFAGAGRIFNLGGIFDLARGRGRGATTSQPPVENGAVTALFPVEATGRAANARGRASVARSAVIVIPDGESAEGAP